MSGEMSAEKIVGEEATETMRRVVGLILGMMAKHGRFLSHTTVVDELAPGEVDELEKALDAAELIMMARGITLPPPQQSAIVSARRIINLARNRDS